MPLNITYPGVYIDELPSAVRTIVGVPTAVAAFVGPATRGPVDTATHITSWMDFERTYGGLSDTSLMSYAVFHYYQNGGVQAEIVRVVHQDASPATITLLTQPPAAPGGGAAGSAVAASVMLSAKYSGEWGSNLRARVDYDTEHKDDAHWNLTVRDTKTGTQESFRNISTDAASPQSLSLDKILRTSTLVTVEPTPPNLTIRPAENKPLDFGQDPFEDETDKEKATVQAVRDAAVKAAKDGGTNDANAAAAGDNAAKKFTADPANSRFTQATGGHDGSLPGEVDYHGDSLKKTGIYALLDTDIFTILCIPPPDRGMDFTGSLITDALNLCVDRRAMLIVDPPHTWDSVENAVAGALGTDVGKKLPINGPATANAAIYFPRITLPDANGQLQDFPPCGAIAGVWARTDGQRGVWKAPAGTAASVNGVRALTVPITDGDNGRLNPLGVNCLRTLPAVGSVVWGARTLRGADRLANQWKYLPVRRTALYLEESLYRGLQWVVFEPNDEPLWAAIRLNVGAFMNSLFRQGAFQGRTPQDAYLVKCDTENNPQNDIDRGIVNVLVGFAPLKPAEFVLIHIQQLAGQLQT